MKRVVVLLFAASTVCAWVIPAAFSPLGVGGAYAALYGVLLNGLDPGVVQTLEVTAPPLVTASSRLDHTWVNFRYKGATWRLQMTNGVTPYCLQMPVIPAGTVEYRIEGGTAFDPYSSTNAVEWSPGPSTYHTYVNTATLTNARKPNMQTWHDNVFYPNYDNGAIYSQPIDDDWRASKLSMSPYYLILPGHASSLGQPHLDPAVRTMAPKTVGSIWFKAKYIGSDGAGTLSIERSTSANPSTGNVVLQTIQVPTTTKWVQYRIDLNDVSGLNYYRIRHPSGSAYGAAYVNVKDIVLTPPVADVAITKEMVEHDPGYPTRTDPVTFTVSVTNVFAGAPASNISPKLVWRLNKGLVPGGWNTTYMPPIGGDQYQVTLPPLDPGDFQYYYRADFTGYAYTGNLYPTAGTVLLNPADFADWADADNNIAETRSPAVLPDFPGSQFFDLSVNPPVNEFSGQATTNAFSYYSFEITE